MDALILVDIQNDFLPGGELAVKMGDAVVPVANELQRHFDLVVATKDWHPAGHKSFATNHPGKKEGEVIELHGLQQMLWPPHCIQDTIGAEFSAELVTTKIQKIFYKGEDPDIDSYSGFYDNGHQRATGLEEYLKDKKIKKVYLVGLTTDYCIKFTALDAIKAGFETVVVADGTMAVNLNEGDDKKALEEMKAKRVTIIHSREILNYR